VDLVGGKRAIRQLPNWGGPAGGESSSIGRGAGEERGCGEAFRSPERSRRLWTAVLLDGGPNYVGLQQEGELSKAPPCEGS